MPTVVPPSTVTGTPPTATSAPAPTGASVTPVEASVASLPDKIQQLLRQIQVNGTISSPPDAGTITLSTVLGNLTILLPKLADAEQQKLLQQLNTLFQSQRPITVVVQPGDPPTQAFLLLPPSASTAAQNVSPSGTPVQIVPPQIVTATVGATLSAIVLPSLSSSPAVHDISPLPSLGAGPFANPVQSPALEAGSILPEAVAKAEATLSQLQTQLPQSLVPQSTQAAQPLQPAALQPQTAPQTLEELLQPGNTVDLQINAIIPPTVSASAPINIPLPPQANGTQILATVTGVGPNGQLTLQAGNSTLYVKQTSDLSVGTQLLVTVTASRNDVAPPVTFPDIQNFASLQQVFNALAQINPQMAQQVLSHIPQPNAVMPAAMMFMLSAFKQGNVHNWLGDDVVDAMSRAGKMNLITKLVQDLTQAGQSAKDSVVGEWRSYPIPINNNGQFQMLNLYVHNDGQRQSSGEQDIKRNAGHVRFLIDMRMSRLGAIQLDGFVQPKKLDMIVRSETGLPQGLHQDLRSGYIKAMEAIDYTGSLNFQVGRQHWLNVQNAGARGQITT